MRSVYMAGFSHLLIWDEGLLRDGEFERLAAHDATSEADLEAVVRAVYEQNPSVDFPRGVGHAPDTPCKGPAMASGRCRMHGGASTGPRTPEGLQRIRKAPTEAWPLLG